MVRHLSSQKTLECGSTLSTGGVPGQVMLTSTRMGHNYHLRRDPYDQGHRDSYGRPLQERYDSRMDNVYEDQYQGYRGQDTYARGDAMESLRYGQPQDSTKVSSQYPRSVWEDFPEEYGRPISPDVRPAKSGTRECDDDDLDRYKREPAAQVGYGDGENWYDVAERVGWRETLQVLEDVMAGRVDPREMNAYGALRLLAACRGYNITKHMAIEQLEDMLDQIVEQRDTSMEPRASHSHRRGYNGYSGWY